MTARLEDQATLETPQFAQPQSGEAETNGQSSAQGESGTRESRGTHDRYNLRNRGTNKNPDRYQAGSVNFAVHCNEVKKNNNTSVYSPEDKDPITMEDIYNSPNREHWQRSMSEGMACMDRYRAFRICDPPPGARIVKNRWHHRIKRDEHGNITRLRSRWILCGFNQRAGID